MVLLLLVVASTLEQCCCQETHADELSDNLEDHSNNPKERSAGSVPLQSLTEKLKEYQEEVAPSPTGKPPVITSEAELEVVQLTSRTFGNVTSDENVWLIEFYADWCGHCTSFAGTYAEIARYYHSHPEHKIKVARVNVNERALTSRFGVRSFPSFFVVDGWSVYVYDKARSKKNLMNFVSGGYKQEEPLPFYMSPMGPLGLAQGWLINAGFRMSNVFQWLQGAFGLSPLMAGTLMFGSSFMGCFFLIVFLAIAITPKAKLD